MRMGSTSTLDSVTGNKAPLFLLREPGKLANGNRPFDYELRQVVLETLSMNGNRRGTWERRGLWDSYNEIETYKLNQRAERGIREGNFQKSEVFGFGFMEMWPFMNILNFTQILDIWHLSSIWPAFSPLLFLLVYISESFFLLFFCLLKFYCSILLFLVKDKFIWGHIFL